MLVLTRKPNQQLTIGKDIVITVVKVRGNTIRLGIDAPKDVRVIRSELELRIDNHLTQDLETVDEASDAICSAGGNVVLKLPLVVSEEMMAADPSLAPAPQSATNKTVSESSSSGGDSKAQLKSSMPTRASVTGHSAVKASNHTAAPLRAFKNNRGQANQLGVAAPRNLEDSPMCHRSSLGQRELESPNSIKGSVTADRSW